VSDVTDATIGCHEFNVTMCIRTVIAIVSGRFKVRGCKLESVSSFLLVCRRSREAILDLDQSSVATGTICQSFLSIESCRLIRCEVQRSDIDDPTIGGDRRVDRVDYRRLVDRGRTHNRSSHVRRAFIFVIFSTSVAVSTVYRQIRLSSDYQFVISQFVANRKWFHQSIQWPRFLDIRETGLEISMFISFEHNVKELSATWGVLDRKSYHQSIRWLWFPKGGQSKLLSIC
jgi:hypothetical protein